MRLTLLSVVFAASGLLQNVHASGTNSGSEGHSGLSIDAQQEQAIFVSGNSEDTGTNGKGLVVTCVYKGCKAPATAFKCNNIYRCQDQGGTCDSDLPPPGPNRPIDCTGCYCTKQ